jgi:hypothetical protein
MIHNLRQCPAAKAGGRDRETARSRNMGPGSVAPKFTVSSAFFGPKRPESAREATGRRQRSDADATGKNRRGLVGGRGLATSFITQDRSEKILFWKRIARAAEHEDALVRHRSAGR